MPTLRSIRSPVFSPIFSNTPHETYTFESAGPAGRASGVFCSLSSARKRGNVRPMGRGHTPRLASPMATLTTTTHGLGKAQQKVQQWKSEKEGRNSIKKRQTDGAEARAAKLRRSEERITCLARPGRGRRWPSTNDQPAGAYTKCYVEKHNGIVIFYLYREDLSFVNVWVYDRVKRSI